MKPQYSVHYLVWTQTKSLTEELLNFASTFVIEGLCNAELQALHHDGEYCRTQTIIKAGQTLTFDLNTSYNLIAKANMAYLRIRNGHRRQVYVFYSLPPYLLEMSIDYHHWKWETKRPGLILIPNLLNDRRLYLPLRFKAIKAVPETSIKDYKWEDDKRKETVYVTPEVTFKFYLETRYPISIYDQHGTVVLGESIGQTCYIDHSVPLKTTEPYYLSCNEVISRKIPSLIRISLGVYDKDKLLYSDYLVCKVAPVLFMPNRQRAKTIFVAKVEGRFANDLFLKEVTSLLEPEGYKVRVLEDPNISAYHRWIQDIFKITYMGNGKINQPLVLKGPHFAVHSKPGGKLDYIYDFFKAYPLYDFYYDHDHNHDDYGNIQVIPMVTRAYPFGRIIYGGIAPGISAPEIEMSYNVKDFLEAQQIQKPISVPTDWLCVGHVDEILSYVPDPQQRLGCRILIASPRKFLELIKTLDPQTFIFDNKIAFHMFASITATQEVKDRYRLKTDTVRDRPLKSPKDNHCLYQSQVKVQDLLDWAELQADNAYYQSRLDEVRSILMKELGLAQNEFYEIPVYYWPKSVNAHAKGMFPNMINNLYVEPMMLVPKPFAITKSEKEEASTDLFEAHFRAQVPASIKVHFVRNWDSYYLLDGDINCGTNTEREPFKYPWWGIRPEGAYDL